MNSTVTYSKLTKEDFGKGLMQQIQPENRQFYAQTGVEGFRQYSKSIKRHFLIEQLNTIYEQKKITSKEYSTIVNMINSDDERDREFAEIIIETKEKIYESNI